MFEAYRLKIESAEPERAWQAKTPTTISGLAPFVRAFFRRFEDPNDPLGNMKRLQHAMTWEFSREVTVPRRQAWINQLISTEFPGLARADRERLSDLFVVLLSASMGEALRGYLDRSAAEMVDRVGWALDALSAYARQRSTRKRG